MADDFDIQTFLPYLLNRAAETAGQAFQQHYKARYGMLRTEWRVLFHLGRYGALTATDIGTRAGIHKTKISRAVAALAAKRYLVRVTRDSDRRQEELRLTPAGKAVFDDLCKAAAAFDAKLAARFSPEDTATLRRCLSVIAAPVE
ncbi:MULTISPECIES: MarR family winged helix-turn-helix transcriptional regulator [unclassified Yoonia]|uniref:MarR family winged helix-turn-helix transcriptional regulator n=1 Tax=unclassified Yoonia TaxID=2629118 RepID=UPI002AFFC8CC|nr:MULTISPECIES: MarR family winged helix-turn-helix transcriptional regulator [unclassified Yoonia]